MNGQVLLILVWGLSCFALSSEAQEQRSIQNFSTQDGLPHSTVFRVCQPRSGAHLWLGTDLGLCRYDGKHFQKYIFSEPVQLNYVLTIKAYGADTLIISYYKEGLFLFHHGQLEAIGSADAGVNRVITVGVDEARRIWALENSKVQVWNQEEWKPFTAFEHFDYTALCEAPGGGILIGTKHGLLWHQGDRTRRILPELKNIWKEGLIKDEQGQVWIAANRAIYRMDASMQIFKWMELPGVEAQKIVLHATPSGLWGAWEKGGLFLFQDGQLEQIHFEGQAIAKVTDIESDHEGNIWVSTSGEGLYQIALAEAGTLVDRDILVNRMIRLGEKELLLGGIGTLHRWDGKILEEEAILGPGEILLSHHHSSPNGPTWLGTNLRVLSYDKAATPVLQTLDQRSISTWLKIPGDGFVIGYYEKLLLTNDQLEREDSILLAAPINTLLVDSAANLWIGTSKGLYQSPLDDLGQARKVNALMDVQIRDMIQDQKGGLWLATSTGVAHWDRATWQYFSFRERGVGSRCNVVLEDAEQRIWIGTSNGLFYTSGDGFQKYFPLHLFLKEEILSLQIDGEERLWVGTSSGLFYIDLSRVESSMAAIAPPPVQITAITTPSHRHLGINFLQIPYTENRLTIDFTAISFRYHDQINFHYQLLGRDEDWHQTFVDHIVYEQLPPGNYTFALKANYHYCEATSAPVYFSFQVIPPFWQRYWFIGLLIALASGLGYWSVARYIRKVKGQEKQKRQAQAAHFATEQKIEQLRQEALNAMMNPHFISNALGSIRHYLQSHTTLETDQLITDFADLIRLNLKYSRATYITLEVAIHRLQYYLRIEQYRFDHQFQYTFTVDEAVDVEEIKIPNMVIQPFVENAIWWGILPQKNQAGKIELYFQLMEEDLLEVKIVDNGIGFSKSKQQNRRSKSMGIDLIRQRLALCGQSHPIEIRDIITSDSSTVAGTCVLLRLKV